ncbi:MAG TPA: glycosyltransferase [Burkholderiaceae bacterium]|nr:glycosyltransferase [Burkholderiaceae bacterium]
MDHGKKRILLITCFFYPQNRIPVLRVGQWAKYWALQGHEVTVLTTKKYGFSGPFGLNPAMPEGVSVVEVPYLPAWLERRLERSPVPGGGPQGAASSVTQSRTSILKQKVRGLRQTIGSLLDIHDLWVAAAYKVGMALIAQGKYDSIVSSYSPPAVHVVASKLKRAHPELIWCADFRDLWANNHITSAKGLFRKLENAKERRTLDGIADALITVSHPLAVDLQSRYAGLPVWVIENGFDPEEFPRWTEDLSASRSLAEGIHICYAGTIYPHRRDPTPLFRAINELIDAGLIAPEKVSIQFYGQNEKELRQIIERSNANRHNIIHINGFVTRQASLAAQKKSSLLLLLESGEAEARGVLTGKLFEYLVSGTPILAVGIDRQNAAGELLETTGTGCCSTNTDELKQLLLAAMKSGKFEFFKPRIELITQYARDKQAQLIIDRVSSLQGAVPC